MYTQKKTKVNRAVSGPGSHVLRYLLRVGVTYPTGANCKCALGLHARL